MQLLLLASAGGAIGAGLRFLVSHAFAARGLVWFPWATLSVNVIGSFLMGVLVGLLALRYQGSAEIRTFFATGILGGFTTFSAFAFESVAMIERGEFSLTFLYMIGSVVLSVVAVFFGLSLTRAVLA